MIGSWPAVFSGGGDESDRGLEAPRRAPGPDARSFGDPFRLMPWGEERAFNEAATIAGRRHHMAVAEREARELERQCETNRNECRRLLYRPPRRVRPPRLTPLRRRRVVYLGPETAPGPAVISTEAVYPLPVRPDRILFLGGTLDGKELSEDDGLRWLFGRVG